MPVRKFRRVDQLGVPERPSVPLWRRLAELWKLSRRLYPRVLPSGVHKNRSIEEAARRRRQWVAR